jgi:hypothetical protein
MTSAISRHTCQELLLEPEDLSTALRFMAQARPERGTSYDGNERFEHGRSVILRWLAESAYGSPAGYDTTEEADREGLTEEELAAAQISQADLLYECAEVLYFLANLEPQRVKDYCDESDVAHSGGCRVLEWIERRLLRVSGYDDEKRPHKTTGERAAEAEAVRDAEAERDSATVN